MQTLRARPHLVALALTSVLAAPVALAQQAADGASLGTYTLSGRAVAGPCVRHGGGYLRNLAAGPGTGRGAVPRFQCQYARFDNRVQGDGLARESYDSRAGIGSLEGGYTFNVWQGVSSNLYLQPQLQLS